MSKLKKSSKPSTPASTPGCGSCIRDRLDALKATQKKHPFDGFDEELTFVYYCPLQEYLEKVQDVRQLILECQAEINTVAEIQDKILSTPVTSGQNHIELDKLVDQVQRKTRLVSVIINRMYEELYYDVCLSDHGGSNLHHRIKKTQQLVLAQIFCDTINMFSKVQSKFR